MWLDRDDARSDVVLAAASAAFGPGLLSFLLFGRLPAGTVGSLVVLAVMFTATGLVPFLLARYRNDVPGAFGVARDDPTGLGVGLLLGVPTISLFVAVLVANGASLVTVLRGRLALSGPTLGSTTVTELVLRAAEGVVMAWAAWLLISFLAVRGRDAYRANEIDVTEGLRTYGLALAGASLVLGLLRSIAGFGLANALLTAVAGFAVVLIADRQIPPRVSVNRWMLLVPTIAVVVIQFFLTGGGLATLLGPLHRGVSGAILALVVASMVAVGRTRATLVLVAAAAFYPTCLNPLPIERLLGIPPIC